ncbi:MAG: hypothetical protein JWM11_3362 [Planctomycetaceae bacterium]|nr:hypothetical protein [Planctomycetaceae bacterium]
MHRLINVSILALLIVVINRSSAAPAAEPSLAPILAAPVAGMTEWDHHNLERNLRWILSRERQLLPAPAKVAVFADAGVWHVGVRSIVEALETEGVPCRVLDRSQLRPEVLNAHQALILPGGWAPFQWAAAGETGLSSIKGYVERGGRCLAICAGAYLISRETKYEGKIYPYPLGLYDGTAEGPVPGLAVFPKPGSVSITVTAAGTRRGLEIISGQRALYSGGPSFVGGTGCEILARYPNGSSAAISRPVGKGEVILLGVHFERPAPETGDDHAPVPVLAGKVFKTVLFPTPR